LNVSSGRWRYRAGFGDPGFDLDQMTAAATSLLFGPKSACAAQPVARTFHRNNNKIGGKPCELRRRDVNDVGRKPLRRHDVANHYRA
jgi:hypothetical protein